MIVPLLAPHVADVLVGVAVIAVGPAILVLDELTHPFASVTITVYVPAPSPLAVAPDIPPGVQLYVKVPVPPLALAVAVPLLPPLQLTVVVDIPVIVAPPLLLTTDANVLVQPLLSVMVTVYVPDEIPDAVLPVAPLLHTSA